MYTIDSLSGNTSLSKNSVFELFSLAGKSAVVTGSAMGIGQMMAVALAGAGAKVALLDIADTSETKKMIEENGGTAISIYCDLAKVKETGEAIFKDIHDQFGSIDILINCGGTTFRCPAIDYPIDKFEQIININLESLFILSQIAARYMKEQGGGKILNMASALSFQGGITVPAYAASKGGVGQITKSFSNEWAQYNINVNALAPGYIDTALNAALVADPKRNSEVLSRVPAHRWGHPSDFLGTVIFLCSPASDYISGHILCVDGGYQGR